MHKIIDTKFFKIIYPEEESKFTNFVINGIDDFVSKTINLFEFDESKFNYSIEIFNNLDKFIFAAGKTKETYKGTVGQGGGKDKLIKLLCSSVCSLSEDEMKQILQHEAVHALSDVYNFFTDNWIDEGLAVWLSGQEADNQIRNVKSVPPTVQAIANKSAGFLWYHYAGCYVEYLANQLGLSKFMESLINESEKLNEMCLKPNFEAEALNWKFGI